MRDLANLKICFIAGTLGQGGAERQLFCILKALRQSGARPHLLCLTQGEFWEKRIRELGVEITWVGQSGSRWMRLRRIMAELRKYRPAIFQSQHFYTNLYTVAAARLLAVREVGAMRNDGISEVQANGFVLGHLSLRAPRVIAANSRAAIRNAIELGVPSTRLHFLPNVLDITQFKPFQRHNGGPIRLVSVGRLVQQKRFDRLLSLLARLRQQLSIPVTAKIVGDGPLRPRLERKAAELGLWPDVVSFAGAVADINAVYQDADIFVLTSDWEGTPNVLLEAMASGLPVVATRVGGVPDIVEHGETGYLADPEDEASLAEALSALIGDAKLRRKRGLCAREYVAAHHSANQLPKYLSQLYEVTLS
jgi:glycosyltransferase involved in cell wall biosynthesis